VDPEELREWPIRERTVRLQAHLTIERLPREARREPGVRSAAARWIDVVAEHAGRRDHEWHVLLQRGDVRVVERLGENLGQRDEPAEVAAVCVALELAPDRQGLARRE